MVVLERSFSSLVDCDFFVHNFRVCVDLDRLRWLEKNNNNTKFVKRRVAVALEVLAKRTVEKHRRRTNVL